MESSGAARRAGQALARPQGGSMTRDRATPRTRPAATTVVASPAGTALAARAAAADGPPLRLGVSSYQKHVDRRAVRAKGARFVSIKATESDSYRNPHF